VTGAGSVGGIAGLAAAVGRFIRAALRRVGRRGSSPPQGSRRGPTETVRERRPSHRRSAAQESVAGRGARTGSIRVLDRPHDAGSGTHDGDHTLALVGAREAPPGQRVAETRSQPTSRTVVSPIDRPYWDLKHWQLKGDQLVGFYRTRYGSYEGCIKHPRFSRPEFYIVEPPEQLRHHPHWICFHSIGGNRYAIHFSPAPPNPDAGILEVEKVLVEALSGQRRQNG